MKIKNKENDVTWKYLFMVVPQGCANNCATFQMAHLNQIFSLVEGCKIIPLLPPHFST